MKDEAENKGLSLLSELWLESPVTTAIVHIAGMRDDAQLLLRTATPHAANMRGDGTSRRSDWRPKLL